MCAGCQTFLSLPVQSNPPDASVKTLWIVEVKSLMGRELLPTQFPSCGCVGESLACHACVYCASLMGKYSQ